ncbi:hypothetical protein CLU79DRAFT_769093 [Phycomyces nitens]|nr:hypothetical protein CLU79DRAFT_769093 [Phycomyces nitens]
MPPSPPGNRKLTNPSANRNLLVERCSSLRACEACKRKRRVCSGQRPCAHCTESSTECVFIVVSDHPRSVFSTTNARRLSSGSACETCRRRKTKCDGSSPCSFCSTNGIDCVNNSERRKRTMAAPPGDNEAIDRIEDRLRRIERLMSAINPSPLSQSTSFSSAAGPTTDKETQAHGTLSLRKLSSPHPPPSPAVRQHRHSVQGISASKEHAELRTAFIRAKPPSDPSSTPPPLSPTSSGHTCSTAATQPLTSSMLNLTLSPSSSTTSSTSNSSTLLLLQSVSTPTSPPSSGQRPGWPCTTPYGSPPTNISEWKTTIPSLMDQLSKRTFVSTNLDYSVHYPIYPLTPPSTAEPEPTST